MATKAQERSLVERKCVTCGKKFTVQHQTVAAGGGKYCCRRCSPEVRKSDVSRRKSSLGATHDLVKRKCPTCGEEFITKVKNINRGGGVFCSLKCNTNVVRSTEEDKKQKRRNYSLIKSYGITTEDYEQMLYDQGGGCAICGSTIGNGRHKNLFVDHDHGTGIVRGLLCGRCNSAIGLLSEDLSLLVKIRKYLS